MGCLLYSFRPPPVGITTSYNFSINVTINWFMIFRGSCWNASSLRAINGGSPFNHRVAGDDDWPDDDGFDDGQEFADMDGVKVVSPKRPPSQSRPPPSHPKRRPSNSQNFSSHAPVVVNGGHFGPASTPLVK